MAGNGRKRPSTGSLTQALCDDLRGRILNGEYAGASFLPSESALCDTHAVSRITVRRALKRLADGGWIASRPGKGWEVLWNRPDEPVQARRVVGLVYRNGPDAEVIFGAARKRFDEEGWATRFFPGYISDEEVASSLPLEQLRGILCYSGVPLSRSFLDRAQEHDVRVVCIGHEVHQSYDCVSVDNMFSFELLAAHLIKEGHRHIAYLSADVLTERDPGFVRRESGYRAAMRNHGLRPAIFYLPQNVFDGVGDESRVLEWLSDLREQGRPPTAIICTTCGLANGLLGLLAREGLRLPEDILVTGFAPMYSDEMLREHGLDRYLALEDPDEQMGEVGANRLLSRLAGDTSRAHLTLLRPKFVVYRRTRQWAATTIST